MANTDTIIKIGLYDVTAKDDVTPSTNDKQSFVDLSELQQEIIAINKYATLEKDRFLLDGTYNPFPDDPQPLDMGYWSQAASDAQGDFATPPTLTFTFTMPHSSVGLTVDNTSNGDYDYNVHVKWYGAGDVLIKEGDYLCKQGIHVIEENVVDYQKVKIQFTHTSKPYRLIKLDYIAFGVLLSYSGQDIVSARLVEEVNPLSFTVPVDHIDFKLFSEDKDFSMANPKGIYIGLQHTQRVNVTGIVRGETVNFGTFWLDDWEQETEQISRFTAIDSIGILNQSDFEDGQVYVNATVESIIDAIMLSANWKLYEVQDALKNVQVSGWIPICTHREALQQVAFAIGAAVRSTRQDTIEIYVPDQTEKAMSKNNKLTGAKAKQNQLVTSVHITAHNFVQAAQAKEVYKATLPVGEYKLTFTAPYTSYTATGATLSKTSTNYCIINVAALGEVVVSAMPYDDQEVLVIDKLQVLPAGAKENVVKVPDAKLVNADAAQVLAPKIRAYFDNRRVDDFRYIMQDEQAGDFVRVDSIGDTQLLGRIERSEINMSGGYISKMKVVGKSEVV